MKQVYNIIFLVLGICYTAIGFSQSTAESVYALQEKERLDYILEHIYEIRSTNMDSGLHYINYAIELSKSLKESNKEVLAHKEKGIIYFYLGDFEKELQSFQEGLTLAEQLGDKALQGNVLTEMGLHYNRQKEYRKSLSMQLQAKELCEEGGDSICVANTLRNYGRLFLKLQNVDSAEIFLVQSYELKKILQDSVGLPYALNDLAEISGLRGDLDAAVGYLKESSRIREALKDTTGIAININNIGEVYYHQKDYKNAIDYFERSLVYSRAVKFVPLQEYTLGMIGNALKAVDNYELAYQYLQESKSLNDSIYSVEKAKALSEMSTKYETEKKEQIIAQQQADLRIQRLIGFSVLSILLLVGLIVYYRVYQRRKYERQIQQLQIQQKIQKERERISRDLHDSVGANLTKIVTDLDLLSLQFEMSQTQHSPERIEKTRNYTQSTIRLLRDTIWAMNKDTFSVLEFSNKVEAFLGYYLEDHMRWEVSRSIKTEKQLTPTQVLNLLRILQEATQNMLKYSKASQFKIAITNDVEFRMNIQDDGVGMSLDNQDLEDSYGLYNMNQRAKDIEASYTIESEEGKGVEIEVRL